MRNWYVITGGPSAGKTTLIEVLEKIGLHVEHESARIVIDEELALGKTIEEIRKDEKVFQNKVYKHKLNCEKQLDPTELIFFDRGMQDTQAYCNLHNFSIDRETRDQIKNTKYKKVFLLESASFEKDYARVESPKEQIELFNLLREVYEKSNLDIKIVPAFATKEERIAYFFDYLRNKEGLSIPNNPVL